MVLVWSDSDWFDVDSGGDEHGVPCFAAGHLSVYSWDGTNWSKVGNDIDGEAAYDRSGDTVWIDSDGSLVAIGAYAHRGP